MDLSPVQNELRSLSSALKSIQAKLPAQDDNGKRSADAAQQAAHWAFWMVMVALIDTIITGFGVWLIWNTWREAERSANEARRQANAAEATLQETRDSTGLELRAYLSVEPDGINYGTQPGTCLGHIVVRNVGKLPARNVFVVAHLTMSTTQPALFYPGQIEIVERVIQPGAAMRLGTVEDDSPLPDSIWGDVFVWGIAHYTDGFNKRRFTQFCHRYDHKRRVRYVPRTVLDQPPDIVISAVDGQYHTQGNDAD